MQELQQKKTEEETTLTRTTHIHRLLLFVTSCHFPCFYFFLRPLPSIPIYRTSARAKYIYATYYLNDDTPLHAFYDDIIAVFRAVTTSFFPRMLAYTPYYMYNECIRVYSRTYYGTILYASTPPFRIGLSRIVFCQDVMSNGPIDCCMIFIDLRDTKKNTQGHG